uniref:Late embryogenesis abundant protein LEA-2 subgroup domain-containing protein n=1 Tax=Leersia perrieri TaxID=77586 RepID=A0A0D9X4R1_9ORYZ
MSTTAAHGGGGHGLHHHHNNQNQLHLHPRGRRAHRSGPLEWTAAVVFTVLAVVILIAAVAVLVIVLLLQPRAPYLAIRSAHLDGLVYDQTGTLEAELSIGAAAENGNARSAAAFTELELRVAFRRMVIAVLRADPFVVPARGSLPLGYVARSSGIPLDGEGMEAMEAALAAGVVPFSVAGEARTRWKVGGLVPFKYWTRLRCDLKFFWPNGTALDLSCSSKPKSKSISYWRKQILRREEERGKRIKGEHHEKKQRAQQRRTKPRKRKKKMKKKQESTTRAQPSDRQKLLQF